ncbi:ABC transporter ATP-binding protein [Chloroflexota bacterium]
MRTLLEIKEVSVNFYTYEGIVNALNKLNLDIYQGETLGLVGETGCGKTMAALSILRLIMPPGKIEGGNIYFYNNSNKPIDLLSIKESQIRAIRGSQISMVFQEPGAALNPVYTIGDQITEVILLHRRQELAGKAVAEIDKLMVKDHGRPVMIVTPFRNMQRRLLQRICNNPDDVLIRVVERIPVIRRLLWRLENEAVKITVTLLKEVEIADPERVIKQHPHELSGGMKQRSVIAMALACRTKLLIADEPTTALDVTIQAQILNLIKILKEELQTSVLYITHDLAVAAEICDRVGVMYEGSICEIAGVEEIYKKPMHPYTQALMAAVPKPGEKLFVIKGFVPDPLDLPTGCRFHPRCSCVKNICQEKNPTLVEITAGHFVSCHLYDGEIIGKAD